MLDKRSKFPSINPFLEQFHCSGAHAVLENGSPGLCMFRVEFRYLLRSLSALSTFQFFSFPREDKLLQKKPKPGAITLFQLRETKAEVSSCIALADNKPKANILPGSGNMEYVRSFTRQCDGATPTMVPERSREVLFRPRSQTSSPIVLWNCRFHTPAERLRPHMEPCLTFGRTF